VVRRSLAWRGVQRCAVLSYAALRWGALPCAALCFAAMCFAVMCFKAKKSEAKDPDLMPLAQDPELKILSCIS